MRVWIAFASAILLSTTAALANPLIGSWSGPDPEEEGIIIGTIFHEDGTCRMEAYREDGSNLFESFFEDSMDDMDLFVQDLLDVGLSIPEINKVAFEGTYEIDEDGWLEIYFQDVLMVTDGEDIPFNRFVVRMIDAIASLDPETEEAMRQQEAMLVGSAFLLFILGDDGLFLEPEDPDAYPDIEGLAIVEGNTLSIDDGESVMVLYREGNSPTVVSSVSWGKIKRGVGGW